MHDSVWVLGIDRIFSGGGVESSFKKVDHLFLVVSHHPQNTGISTPLRPNLHRSASKNFH